MKPLADIVDIEEGKDDYKLGSCFLRLYLSSRYSFSDYSFDRMHQMPYAQKLLPDIERFMGRLRSAVASAGALTTCVDDVALSLREFRSSRELDFGHTLDGVLMHVSEAFMMRADVGPWEQATIERVGSLLRQGLKRALNDPGLASSLADPVFEFYALIDGADSYVQKLRRSKTRIR